MSAFTGYWVILMFGYLKVMIEITNIAFALRLVDNHVEQLLSSAVADYLLRR